MVPPFQLIITSQVISPVAGLYPTPCLAITLVGTSTPFSSKALPGTPSPVIVALLL